MVGRGETTQISHESSHVLKIQLWNSIRVLDFMQSLDYADPNQVAITSASGGGTQTFLLAAVDDMTAFNEYYPLPGDALTSQDEILNALGSS